MYIMLNKPRDVLSSTEDELDQGRTTVRDLVNVAGHIYPVGRLDKQSEGLILLTNDGQLAHRLTHPRYEHEKVYDVLVEGHPGRKELQQWRQGIMLDRQKTLPARIEVLERQHDSTRLRITLREGRKRQIRRVAAQLGYPVQRLFREQIGPLSVGNLPPGRWRHLTKDEVNALQQAVKQKARPRHRNKRRGKRS
jgi:pseudouridine synthase